MIMQHFTHRELYLAAALAVLAAVILIAAHYWKVSRRRYWRDEAELTQTREFLTELHDPVLKLRRVRPYGQLILNEDSWQGGRIVMRPVDGVYPETSWGSMTLCVFAGWCEDVTAEIGSWAREWGAAE